MSISYSIIGAKQIHWDDYSDKYPGADCWGYLQRGISIKGDAQGTVEHMYFLIFDYRFRVLTREGVNIDELDHEEIVFSYISQFSYVVNYKPGETNYKDLEEIANHSYTLMTNHFDKYKVGNLATINIPPVNDVHNRLKEIFEVDLPKHNLL